jgi:hypothetical protein
VVAAHIIRTCCRPLVLAASARAVHLLAVNRGRRWRRRHRRGQRRWCRWRWRGSWRQAGWLADSPTAVVAVRAVRAASGFGSHIAVFAHIIVRGHASIIDRKSVV